jgi:hypothetical protein
LIGGAGNDVIVAGTGSATMTGNGGNDTFVLHEGGGADVITDFHKGDVVLLEHYTTRDFAAAEKALSQSGGDVVLHLDAGQTLTFNGHSVSDFTAADFAFSGPVYAGQTAVTPQVTQASPTTDTLTGDLSTLTPTYLDALANPGTSSTGGASAPTAPALALASTLAPTGSGAGSGGGTNYVCNSVCKLTQAMAGFSAPGAALVATPMPADAAPAASPVLVSPMH